jgi:hypothetical protein
LAFFTFNLSYNRQLDSEPAKISGTPSSTMPPPPIPSSQIPVVQLQPQMPGTSQEAISAPATLLEVPVPHPADSEGERGSRSRSPAPESSQVRRSPRLSPASLFHRFQADIHLHNSNLNSTTPFLHYGHIPITRPGCPPISSSPFSLQMI